MGMARRDSRAPIDLGKVIPALNEACVFKFGQNSAAQQSPISVDFREVISHPSLLKTIANVIGWTIFDRDMIRHDIICGAAYRALPIAAVISCDCDVPLVVHRKEPPDETVIAGRVEAGQQCIVIDDVCAIGASILETAQDLRNAGLIVTDAVVLVDMEMEGRKKLEENGIKLHAALTLTQVCETMVNAGQLSPFMAEEVYTFIRGSQSSC